MPKTIGRLMPSRSPANDPVDRFIINNSSMIDNEFSLVRELTPKRLKTILAEAESEGHIGELYHVYDKMESSDTRYGGLINQLESAVSGMPLKVIAAEGSTAKEQELAEEYAAVISEALSHHNTHSLTKSFVAPYLVGAKLYQVGDWHIHEYGYGRKLWMPGIVKPVDGRFLHMVRDRTQEDYGKIRVVTEKDPKGRKLESFPKESYIWLEDGVGENRYHQMGVARKILPWYLGIQFVQTWWIQFIETYGAPQRIGKYPVGADNKSKMEMERFLRVLGQHGYALFPAEMEVQLMESNRAGTISTYSDFIKKGHDEYAIAMLGQADTVGDRRNGSFARAEVLNGVRYEILANVASIVSEGYRAYSRNIIGVNYGKVDERLLPRVKPIIMDTTDQMNRANTAVTAQDNGIAVPEDYWYEQILGISRPREGERVIMHGKTFEFGIDPEPKPQENEINSQNSSQPRERTEEDAG